MGFSNALAFKAQTPSALLPSNLPASIAVPTDEQRKDAKHREIARHYARQRRKGSRPSIVSLTIADLETVFADRYGSTFPDDDAGRGDLIVLLQYVSQLGDPRAMAASAARWCPWLSEAEYTAMLAGIGRKPLRWRADALAGEIGLNRATRTRLGITTIGAIDFCKAKRTKRRKKRNNADKLARRLKAGAAPHAASAERVKPWEALGISRRTYYRNRANGTFGTDSGTAARIYMGVPNQCHAVPAGASAQADLTRSDLGVAVSAALNQSPAFEIAETGRDSAFAGRLCLHWIKKGKNPFDNLSRKTLASQDMDRAA
jgi:hypothetical protein